MSCAVGSEEEESASVRSPKSAKKPKEETQGIVSVFVPSFFLFFFQGNLMSCLGFFACWLD